MKLEIEVQLEIEKELRNKAGDLDRNKLSVLLKSTAVQLQKLSPAITQLASNTLISGESSKQPDEMDRVLERIEELLRHDDVDVITLVNQHTPSLNTLFGEAFVALKSQIDNFDFSTAQETLERLLVLKNRPQ